MKITITHDEYVYTSDKAALDAFMAVYCASYPECSVLKESKHD